MATETLGEFDFINRIRRGCRLRPADVVVPIGDDAAAIRRYGADTVLATKDLLVEGIHFSPSTIDPDDLGYKALAVNLSDIAAMGGTAKDALVGLAAPPHITLAYLEDLYQGLKSLAAEYKINLIGGDTSRSTSELMISITVLGSVAAEKMLTRQDARPNDRVFVTGFLGASRAGRYVLEEGLDLKAHRDLVRAHVRPLPQLYEGRFLAACQGVHAAIDVSDGFTQDLNHILVQSGVGAVFEDQRLPLSSALLDLCQSIGRDPLPWALGGGEDYCLLLTIDPAYADTVAQAFAERFQRPLFPVGMVTAERGLRHVTSDGIQVSIDPEGWDHFARGATGD
jgi:thiamine-monophosphate kinase